MPLNISLLGCEETLFFLQICYCLTKSVEAVIIMKRVGWVFCIRPGVHFFYSFLFPSRCSASCFPPLSPPPPREILFPPSPNCHRRCPKEGKERAFASPGAPSPSDLISHKFPEHKKPENTVFTWVALCILDPSPVLLKGEMTGWLPRIGK